jgi:glucans biosynthesis protein C
MLTIFFFHNAHFFDAVDWHIKNKQQSFGATVFVAFVHLWSMPLLFLLAGASTWFARDYKSGIQYIVERFKRLVVPFSFGLIIIVPPQIYIEGLSKSQLKGSFFQCFFHLFPKSSLVFDPQIFSNYGHHLWFLAFLFLFSLLDLPISQFLRKETGLRLVSRVTVFLEKRGNIFLSVIPLALIQILLRIKSPAYCSWTDFWYWFIFFIYGYLLMSGQRLMKAIAKRSLIIYIAGVTCLFGIGYLYLDGKLAEWIIHPKFSLIYILFMFLYTFASWALVVSILDWGIRFLNFNHRLLKYCQEAILPFYILHQTVILLIGFYVVQWNLSIFSKFVLISGTSFVITVSLYEFIIKRFNLIRICFGLKPKKNTYSI